MKKFFVSAIAVAMLVSALFVPMTASAATEKIELGDIALNVVEEFDASAGNELTALAAGTATSYSAKPAAATDISAATHIALRVKNDGAAVPGYALITTGGALNSGVFLFYGFYVELDGTMTPITVEPHKFGSIPAGFDGYIVLQMDFGMPQGGGYAYRSGNKMIAPAEQYGSADPSVIANRGAELDKFTEIIFNLTPADANCKVGDAYAVTVNYTGIEDINVEFGSIIAGNTDKFANGGFWTATVDGGLDYKVTVPNGIWMDASENDYLAIRVKNGNAAITGNWSNLKYVGTNYGTHLGGAILIGLDGTIVDKASAGFALPEIPANFDGWVAFYLSNGVASSAAGQPATRSEDGKSMVAIIDDDEVKMPLDKINYFQVNFAANNTAFQVGETVLMNIQDNTPAPTPTPTPEATTPAPEGTTPPTGNPNTGAVSVVALAAVAVVSGGMIVARKKH